MKSFFKKPFIFSLKPLDVFLIPLEIRHKKKCKHKMFTLFGGERGIRTPGTSQYNGFQDRRNRPLCHLSKTPLRECFFSKAMQRYNLFSNPQAKTNIFFKK